jgi:hypothetical protein
MASTASPTFTYSPLERQLATTARVRRFKVTKLPCRTHRLLQQYQLELATRTRNHLINVKYGDSALEYTNVRAIQVSKKNQTKRRIQAFSRPL